MSTPAKKKKEGNKYNSVVITKLAQSLNVTKRTIYLALKNEARMKVELGDLIRKKYAEMNKAMEDAISSVAMEGT